MIGTEETGHTFVLSLSEDNVKQVPTVDFTFDLPVILI